VSPASRDLDLERRLRARAQQFDLRALLALLRARGFRRHEIFFRGTGQGTAAGLIEAIHFPPENRHVIITVNLGLLGDNSLLPSYFLEAIEKHPDRDVRQSFYHFINFFDHRLLRAFFEALYVEDGQAIFRDWAQARRSFLHMVAVDSPGTLHWLAQMYFPELRVHTSRALVTTESASHTFRVGESRLDGSGILGHRYQAEGAGLELDLIAEEETTARGEGWAPVVKRRLEASLLPRLAPFRLHLVVRLRVLAHTSWARLGSPPGPRDKFHGFLGYDRLETREPSGHTIVIFRGRTGTHDQE
jgi:hypothetical protein